MTVIGYLCSGGSRPSDKVGGRGDGLKKIFGRPFGPQFGLKISGEKGGGGSSLPGPSPGSTTALKEVS